MKRLVITAARTFDIVEVSDPVPGGGELLIAPVLVGICATDRELLDGTMIYLRTGRTEYPLTPGHEWVGRVVGYGPGVSGFPIGSVVVGECSIGCGVCSTCRSGNYHRCDDRHETGVLGQQGGMAELMTFPSSSAHLIPATVALEDAALIEPTAVAYRAVLRLAAAAGSSVLVVGAGTLGYLVAVLAASVLKLDVAVIDPRPELVDRLSEFGVRAAKPDERFDGVIEAAGRPAAAQTALERLAPGGRLVLVGLTGASSVPIPLDSVVVSDQEILGSLGSANVWPDVIELIANGAIRPSRLVTHTRDLADFALAVDLPSVESSVGKVLISIGE
jgi:2-desacetyl-2-hydroxyethyl bacteriochlorophyllide A dehydrogenase